MRCTKCGTESTTGKKFCAECGSPLHSRCPKCGANNKPTSKFCEECGAALAVSAASGSAGSSQAASTAHDIRIALQQPDASAVIEGERKTVTALFADIKGSTELMEDLDPEEARAIIDPALKLMIEAVRRYDGYVVQSTGDGIFALFGAPVAHEDHPQRALYAALRMQEELQALLGESGGRGQQPDPRPRRNQYRRSGGAFDHDWRGQTEYTPIGHTTNLASRMQTAAPVGSIAVSESTRRLCEGYFILKPLGATKVKGVSEPVNVYEVTGLGPLRTRLQRSAGRGLTKFVGREREMEALKHAAEQAKAGRGQIVAAMAEPGVGKSRLYFEFKATSQSGWMVLETFSVSHGKASAPICRCSICCTAISKSRARTTNVRGARRSRADSSMLDRLHSKTRCPTCFQLARHRRGRRPARADGRAGQEAADAGSDQTDPAARVAQSAADGDLRGPALDRRGDPGLAQSAGGLDRDGEDTPAGELPSRILTSLE